MAKHIYFDESGFTGYNYLDPLQPIFTLASTDIEPSVAKQILETTFPNYRGAEFKFSILWKSSKSQFVDLAEKLNSYNVGIFFWAIDKPFTVIVKMIDFLIEPLSTAAGYDFLADGFGRKYANYAYYGLKVIASPGCLETLTEGYQIFSRSPSRDALKVFKATLKSEYRKQLLEVKALISQLIDGAESFEKFHDMDDFKNTNDLQFTAMLAAVADWRKKFNDDFIIVHDASSNFLRQKETWATITGNDVPKQMHPLGDGSFVEFPLRVIETHSVNSQDNYSIQLSDLLAGFASRFFDSKRPQDERIILSKIISSGLEQATINGIMAGKEFPDGPPRKLDGPDAVERMMMIMKGK